MKKYLSLIALAIAISGCQNDEENLFAQRNDSVSATIQTEAKSRTTMNVNQVVWEDNDEISIFSDNNGTYNNNQYTLKTGGNTPDATFDGSYEGTKVAAMYPYATDNTYNGTSIALSLESSYNYAEGSNNKAPMAATISSDNENIVFLNAGALMSLKVNNIPVGYTSATLEAIGTNDPAIAGNATITFDNGIPTLTIASDATAKKITISFTALTEKSDMTFYFPLPVADYESLQFSISNGSETKVLKTKALDAKRNIRYTSTITLDSQNGSIPVEATVANAAEKLESSTSITIAEVPADASSPTITLPTQTSGKEVSIAFDAINTDSPIEIKASDETQVASALNITVPTEADKAKLNINLPNTTVTISVYGGSGIIPEVTASTSENTLVVDKGVTITNLNVLKGNVRVKAGAVITNIAKAKGCTQDIIYIYNEGGTVPEKLDEGFILVNSIVNATQDKMYDSISDAITDAASGDVIELSEGTYTLSDAKNITLTFIGTGKAENIKITVASASSMALEGSTVTFKNLTIESSLANYQRFIRMEGTYQNCIINNQYHLGGDSSFDNCTFNVPSKDWYNIWTYGYDATFTKCTFNCEGKSVLVYNDANQTDDTVTFDSCIFNDNGGENGVAKAAIEAAAYAKTDRHTLRINNCTVNGFATTEQNATTYGGTDLGTNVWGNKNLMTSENLKVYINNEPVEHKAAITDE